MIDSNGPPIDQALQAHFELVADVLCDMLGGGSVPKLLTPSHDALVESLAALSALGPSERWGYVGAKCGQRLIQLLWAQARAVQFDLRTGGTGEIDVGTPH